ncbi:MAG: hypothetical protein RLZZ458_950 [Planctomycetota bacterium]
MNALSAPSLALHTLFMGALLLFPTHTASNPPTAATTDTDISVPTLEEAINSMATVIADYIRSQTNIRKVFIREFHAPAGNDRELSRRLAEKLKEYGYTASRTAANEVSGKVKPHNDENGTVIGLCGECSITVKGANPVEEKRKTITFQINSRDVAIPVTTPGTEVLAPPNAPEGTKPDLSGPFIKGTKIRPSKQSSYYVEILARTTGSTEYTVLTPVMRDSYPHVSIKHGSALAVRAGNDTNYEAAIELRLDGLPRFALANDANVRNQNHFDLVSPGSFRDLKGFFLTNQEIAEFTVGNYSNSAAAQVFPDGSDAGTLAISFHAAWEKGKPSPPNEPHRPAKGEKPGIVPGEVRKDPIQIVPRQVGRLRAAVRVLYDNEG